MEGARVGFYFSLYVYGLVDYLSIILCYLSINSTQTFCITLAHFLLDFWNFICSLCSSIWINFWLLTVRVIAAYGKIHAPTMPVSCLYK